MTLARQDRGSQQCCSSRPLSECRMAIAAMTPLGARLPRALAPLAALAYGTAVVVVKPWAGEPPTAYAGASTLAATTGLVVGIGLLGVGSILWVERGRDRVALLLVLTGVAWFARDWVGWEEGPAVVRSVGAVVAPFLPALLLDLVATVTGTRVARLVARVSYASTAVVSVGRALFRDPLLDPRCWSNCTDNVFLVDADQKIARTLDAALPRIALITGLLVIPLTAWRTVSASRAARRSELPLLVALALAGAAQGVFGIAVILDPAESAESASFRALYVGSGAALSLLALAVGWTIARARRRRSAVARIAADLEAAPAMGSLAAALAQSLGDSSLDVAYPVGDRFVDSEGRPVATQGRTATPLVRAGETIALLLHESDAVQPDELERELGSAARLAIENERLRAEVLSRLHDLRASRVRIIETADVERRRIERDLHDGAQQQLLAVSYDLRLALSKADGGLASLLRAGVEEVQAVLEELRELAHGIHPAVLTEAGLGEALRTLADVAKVPLEIMGCTDDRFSTAAEAAAYAVAVEALELAGDDGLVVRADRRGGTLVVEAEGENVAPTIHLADRVGALGGRVTATPYGLRAEIPCA
jgi:signal transduction histidine kinase